MKAIVEDEDDEVENGDGDDDDSSEMKIGGRMWRKRRLRRLWIWMKKKML